MDYRWLTNDEIETELNPVLEQRGMAMLNINELQPTCCVLGAFWDGHLVEAFALHLYPMLGPMLKVDGEFRDDGTVARTLAQKMGQFLEETKARGCIAIADSPVTERLCERFSMEKLVQPVYSYVRKQ